MVRDVPVERRALIFREQLPHFRVLLVLDALRVDAETTEGAHVGAAAILARGLHHLARALAVVVQTLLVRLLDVPDRVLRRLRDRDVLEHRLQLGHVLVTFLDATPHVVAGTLALRRATAAAEPATAEPA